eukprot:TRINITY_DN16484_c0_g1_i3.p3 TRINITY_DN16484_c0_g1~~TRINITY_DN16484_c0_g1_i3.p3  ORF type:complete len:225 (+),score=90.11 TRINITY_DN16484_c0_g1_i3:137-811(+)
MSSLPRPDDEQPPAAPEPLEVAQPPPPADGAPADGAPTTDADDSLPSNPGPVIDLGVAAPPASLAAAEATFAAASGGAAPSPPDAPGPVWAGTRWELSDLEAVRRAANEVEAFTTLGGCVLLAEAAGRTVSLAGTDAAELRARLGIADAEEVGRGYLERTRSLWLEEEDKGERVRMLARPVLQNAAEAAMLRDRRVRRRERKLQQLRLLHAQECYRADFDRQPC